MADRGDEIRTLLGEGQAALWLGENLILALLEANILDTDTILEAIDIVIAAKKAKAAEGFHSDVASAAATQLASISASIAATKVAVSPTGRKCGGRTRKKPST